jgi:lysophospholipase
MNLHGLALRGPYLFLVIVSFLATFGFSERQIPRIRSVGRQVTPSTYAPEPAKCPSGPLVRPANGLASSEKSYVEKRRQIATPVLAKWLQSVDKSFSVAKLPTIGLVSSGGGYRSMLLGGGLIKAMDARESNETTKSLYQAFTYHAGLSGGAWLLSSLAGNDHPTISSLKKDLWQDALVKNSLYPTNTETSKEFPVVQRDLASKSRAGFLPTVADGWGRFLAFQVLRGAFGGAGKTWSSVAHSPSFEAGQAPYPIITVLGVNEKDIYGVCDPFDNSTQYEFTPYEFGSWDRRVAAFTPTESLGSALSNGVPKNGTCVRNYDEIGYIIGTSSNKFQESCGETSLAVIAAVLQPIVNSAQNVSRRNLYAPYPNPFLNYPGSPEVASQPELLLVDGGQGKPHPHPSIQAQKLTPSSKSK